MSDPSAPSGDLFAEAVNLFRGGRLDEAAARCRAVIATSPLHDRAHGLLGLIAQQSGDPAAALDAFDRAIRINSNIAGYHANRSLVLNALGQHDEAISAAREALRLAPDQADSLINLANGLLGKGERVEAITIYRRIIAGAPTTAPSAMLARNNLGRALHLDGRLDDAIAALEEAVRIAPASAEVRINLANALKDQGRIEDAIVQYRAAADAAPSNPNMTSPLLYALWFDPSQSERAIVAAHADWARRHTATLRDARPYANDRDPGRRLRIGYVCPYLRDHPVAHTLEPALVAHDRGRFDLFIYDDTLSPDATTERLRGHVEHWRSTRALTDVALAEQIRADAIDILIDTASHMSEHRLLLFARKPAPVQVTWLAYPATSGLPAMDHRITCPLLDPEDGNDAARTNGERLIRLPHTFWCYCPPPDDPAPNALPALTNGVITFGSLNNFGKVNAAVVEFWSRVLHAVPGSRLMMLITGGAERNRNVAARFERHGIAPNRLRFVGYHPRRDYFRLYHEIDLVLDPFPYNGHTTSIDALWMGVPFVTLAGESAIARGGACMLENVSLRELIAPTRERYVEICAELAHDLPRLSRYRGELRERLRGSPLMDVAAFTRDLETAYRQMWRDFITK